MKLTDKRRAYLENLLAGPRIRQRSGTNGCHLMRAGLTEWDYRHKGEPIAKERWIEMLGEDERPDPIDLVERITPAGRAALEKEREG